MNVKIPVMSIRIWISRDSSTPVSLPLILSPPRFITSLEPDSIDNDKLDFKSPRKKGQHIHGSSHYAHGPNRASVGLAFGDLHRQHQDAKVPSLNPSFVLTLIDFALGEFPFLSISKTIRVDGN